MSGRRKGISRDWEDAFLAGARQANEFSGDPFRVMQVHFLRAQLSILEGMAEVTRGYLERLQREVDRGEGTGAPDRASRDRPQKIRVEPAPAPPGPSPEWPEGAPGVTVVDVVELVPTSLPREETAAGSARSSRPARKRGAQ